jgi:hypothetical protein
MPIPTSADSGSYTEADVYILSFPKCGRTWLRTLMAKALSEARNLPMEILRDLELLYFSRVDSSVPQIAFTHDDHVKQKVPEELSHDKSSYRDKRIIFLTRDLRDVVVSQYFQMTRREPYGRFNGTLDDFISYGRGSLRTCIAFWNIWHDNRCVPRSFLCTSYERLTVDTASELRRILDFSELAHIDDAALYAAVKFASFRNMRAMEVRDSFQTDILRPTDPKDLESYKTRRGIVGGFRDYLNERQLCNISNLLTSGLVRAWWPAAFAADRTAAERE